jgi:hypothetical protein
VIKNQRIKKTNKYQGTRERKGKRKESGIKNQQRSTKERKGRKKGKIKHSTSKSNERER